MLDQLTYLLLKEHCVIYIYILYICYDQINLCSAGLLNVVDTKAHYGLFYRLETKHRFCNPTT